MRRGKNVGLGGGHGRDETSGSCVKSRENCADTTMMTTLMIIPDGLKVLVGTKIGYRETKKKELKYQLFDADGPLT